MLMGMKHSGKSTLGRLLAEARRVPFADLDELVEAEHDPARRTTFREIYAERGAAYFSRVEARAARRLEARIREARAVVALGGGTIENDEAMAALGPVGFFVYLDEEEATLYERIMAGGRPAFLSEEDPRGDFARLYERRAGLYRARADATARLSGVDVPGAFARLVGVLTEAGYAG